MYYNTFRTNSLPKILILSDGNPSFTFKRYNGTDWYSNQFDVILTNSAQQASEILHDYRDSISAIVTQFLDKNWDECDARNFEILPLYMKQKWFHFNDHEDHGDFVYETIIRKELENSVNPRFSFVTPLYNTNPEYFRRCYESLKSQTINDWEWVLLDDSPEPLDWVQNYVKNDIRLRYFRTTPTNGNIGLAKYQANMFSKGAYLIELDHDDEVHALLLQFVENGIKEVPDAGFIYTDTLDIDENDNQIIGQYGNSFAFGYCHPYTIKDPVTGEELYPNMTAPINSVTIRHIVGVPNHARIWRRDVYFNVMGHNRMMRIADDYELIARTFLKTTFLHIAFPAYAQRFDGKNSQDSGEGVNRKDIQRRVELIADFYNEKIHNRVIELYGEEIWEPTSSARTIELNSETMLEIPLNKVYVPVNF